MHSVICSFLRLQNVSITSWDPSGISIPQPSACFVQFTSSKLFLHFWKNQKNISWYEIQASVSINEAECSHMQSFTLCLWLLSHGNGQIVTETLQPAQAQNICYLAHYRIKICQLLSYSINEITSLLLKTTNNLVFQPKWCTRSEMLSPHFKLPPFGYSLNLGNDCVIFFFPSPLKPRWDPAQSLELTISSA